MVGVLFVDSLVFEGFFEIEVVLFGGSEVNCLLIEKLSLIVEMVY